MKTNYGINHRYDILQTTDTDKLNLSSLLPARILVQLSLS